MKKILILSALLGGALFSNAQTLNDGLLYGTQDDLFGTARYRGLSGAFGALGGDLTAVGENPAGSVIFNNHFASFSLGYNDQNNDTAYLGQLNNSSEGDLDLNQAGVVFVFKSTDDATLNKFSLGLNYNITRSYDDNVFFSGVNSNSIGDFFVNSANGFELDNFETRDGESIDDLYLFLGENVSFGAQQGFLGFQSFIIDPDDNEADNTEYSSNTGSGSFNQALNILSSGSQGKISVNGAIQLDEKWSLGLNLNSHYINYSRFTNFTEFNNNDDASVTDVEYNNLLTTDGAGFSFQLGFIGEVTESLRIGATYESPTWYNIEESLSQEIFTRSVDEDGAEFFDEVRPNVVNLYAPFDLRTPGQITGSLAYIFGQQGLISVDYSSRDYSSLEFSPESDPLFAGNNAQAEDLLTRANTLRIGGEYRIDRLTLRGGYRTVGSPYENEDIMSDLTGYSLGLGYNLGKTTIDLSYDYSERDYSQAVFNNGIFTTNGQVFNENSNVVLTVGFNF
ncbi:OmpP1/FadL family transporter [Nonlabens ponticola]|uniref:Hemin receptor n=1 Tax=Nonlabens ponticola TaxID=2496866 RepID=A0A3S9MWZ8_9FLAO|nr:outer membrane protein transport protein [Nonlabens ponticola]AZQ43710.1 hemin receptor [Nonlabens ponticola]